MLRKYVHDVGARPLPRDGSIQGMALSAMQHLNWGAGGYNGGITASNYIFGAVSEPVVPSVGKPKRAGKRVQAIRRRQARALADAPTRAPRPPRSTPTPSECEEIQYGYQEAFDFWLRAQFENIPEPEYIDTAELFDELPGVSGYFRFLCLHTVVKEGDGYVLFKTY